MVRKWPVVTMVMISHEQTWNLGGHHNVLEPSELFQLAAELLKIQLHECSPLIAASSAGLCKSFHKIASCKFKDIIPEHCEHIFRHRDPSAKGIDKKWIPRLQHLLFNSMNLFLVFFNFLHKIHMKHIISYLQIVQTKPAAWCPHMNCAVT